MLPTSLATSVAAYHLLFSLYDNLGVDLDDKTAQSMIDNDLRVHFESQEQGELDMICSLRVLPADVVRVQKVLQMNGINLSVFVADTDDTVLLAISRVSDKNSISEFVEILQGLIQTSIEIRRELGLISTVV